MSNSKDDIIDFSWVIKIIHHPFVLIRKSYLLIAKYIALAVVLSVVLKWVIPPVYFGSFAVKVNQQQDLFFISMLNDISELAKDKDDIGISNELKCSVEEAACLKKINLIPLYKQGMRDTCYSIVIEMRISDPALFPKFQDYLIRYLEFSPHYQKLKLLRSKDLEALEHKINKDMIEMDSVKNLIISNIRPPQTTGNGMVYNVPLNPYNAYQEGMNRFKEQIWLLKQLKYSDTFELIKPCVVSHKPVFPKLLYIFSILIPFAFAIALVHAQIIYKRSFNNQ